MKLTRAQGAWQDVRHRCTGEDEGHCERGSLQLEKMDASARQKAEMAQKIAQELLKSSSHRLGAAPSSMPALSTEQSNLVRAAQQKAAEIAVQVSTSSLLADCLSSCLSMVPQRQASELVVQIWATAPYFI